MMQKILLQVNEELKMEIFSLRNQIQKISRDVTTSCLRVVEETCRSMNPEQNLRVGWNMTQLKQDVQKNVSVQQLEDNEEVKKKTRDEMKEMKNVEEIMDRNKTEEMEESNKWWRWTKWRFWR